MFIQLTNVHVSIKYYKLQNKTKNKQNFVYGIKSIFVKHKYSWNVMEEMPKIKKFWY
jgi:hypothetical protein